MADSATDRAQADALAGAAPPAAEERAIAPLTPMMRQYLETKAQYPDAILFFRLGDFYEMFFEDAVKASQILQITLTSRAKGDERVPMCGVPYHAARGHLARLVEAGLKVAICDQMEEPGKGPQIVRREVTRVVTPGMVLDDDLLEAHANNFLCALAFAEGGGGALALLDASTGEFFAGELESDSALADEVSRSLSREVLLPAAQAGSPRAAELARACPQAALGPFPDEAFEPSRARALLTRHLGVATLDGFGLAGQDAAVGTAGAALRYLKQTQRAEASHVDRIGVLAPGGAMVLDESSRANLEIVRTLRDGKRKGSLLGLLDKTATAMGGRRLARWLSYPLLDLEKIDERLDAVAEL